jgi:hypothetical protein
MPPLQTSRNSYLPTKIAISHQDISFGIIPAKENEGKGFTGRAIHVAKKVFSV